MCFVGTCLFFSHFITSNYIGSSVQEFADNEYSQFSGLFVQADGLGYEGEPRKLQQNSDKHYRVLRTVPATEEAKAKFEIKQDDGNWVDRTKYVHVSSNGYTEYEDDQLDKCWDAWILLPGMYLLSQPTLTVAYLLGLGWLFLGIAIISDIFMEAIETITSITVTEELWDKDQKQKYYVDVPLWNATVANLTLMALGSSAPEILLNVIGTVQDIRATPSELGPSTIVGSAAFNLLVISGLSIIAVDETPKKIDDTGVFFITSVCSLWAYIWLYLVLMIWSKDKVELWEAWATMIFFFILIFAAYSADKMNQFLVNSRKTAEQSKREEIENERNISKKKLRSIANDKGEQVVIAAAKDNVKPDNMTDSKFRDIITLYKNILDVDDPRECDLETLHNVLKPDTLLERFAYRKQTGMTNRREFIKLKGSKGQLEHDNTETNVDYQNDQCCFKCLHYSVTESNGFVEITIIKKVQFDLNVGVRTVADSAMPPKDYEHYQETIQFKKRDEEHKIRINIVDDEEWNPDLEFYVELYDPTQEGNPRLPGDDTRCKVTILDEDFPGTLGFEVTSATCNPRQKKIDVKIVRSEGADGIIQCMVQTEDFSMDNKLSNAQQFTHYLPKLEKVKFLHGETEKIFSVELVPQMENDIDGEKKEDPNESAGQEEDNLLFNIKISDPQPSEVKISKRNVCIVTISKSEDEVNEMEEHKKLLEYYLAQKEATWSSQFKKAVMLGPQIDEDNMLIEDVSFFEAFIHFLSITWKLTFALVPPTNIWGGKLSFLVALSFIGLLTAIVEQFATLLGCVCGIEDSITAITIVALGTSLPDTFASMTAARNSDNADSAIGNITGSNSVNVFLGLGLPWVIACHYWDSNDLGPYTQPAGNISFSVMVFLIVACICFFILVARRFIIGGELGGPTASKYLSCFVLISLWLIYIILSILNTTSTVEPVR